MDDMADRTTVFTEDEGGTRRVYRLTAAWAGLLILGGLRVIFLPQALWADLLFWGMTLVMAVITLFVLYQTDQNLCRLSFLVDQANEMFWTVDDFLCISSVHGAVTDITGRAPSDLAKTPIVDLLSPEKAGDLEKALRKEKGFSMETALKIPEGKTLAVEICGMPSHFGSTQKFSGTIRNLQAVKGQERRIKDMKVKLDRSEKLKNLGLLAGSVAHDLNNILSGIATYPEVLLMDSGLDAKTRQGIEMIKDSGRKASSVVSDLLTISRGARADRQVLNLNTVIQRYMAAAEFEKIEQTYPDVEIEVCLEPELLNMRGSYIHIEKAVMNLMLNAVEETAGKEDGRVRISTTNLYMDDHEHEGLCAGEYVVLRVEDNGSGIPKSFRDKIFDPFFTRKEMGKSGTGLGLTVVKNAVEDHGGGIGLVSDNGGSQFELIFPGIRDALPKSEDTDSLDEIKGHGETILIVDDLPSQRKIGATILGKLGYTVYTVADGMDALAFVRAQPVDLLVLDMIMAPGISGLETYRRIKQIRPDQKAIIASGHSESEDVLRTQELGAGSFVKKPYTIMDMGIAVKEELER